MTKINVYAKGLKMRTRIILMTGLALLTMPMLAAGTEPALALQTADALNGFAPITADNAKDLEIGYAVEGDCFGFDPTGNLFITRTGVYEVASGQKRFPFSGVHVREFSPDGTLFVITQDGVYEVSSGQKRFAISGPAFAQLVFSPDGSLLAVGGDGVYELASGEKRFAISGIAPVFSPDGTLLAVTSDGVYEVASGSKRFPISGSLDPVFSPDGSLLAVGGDGVYELASGQKRFALSDYYFVFSPDGSLLAVGGNGVYKLASGQKRFASSGIFSPDGSLLATDDGVYEVASGQKRFAISGSGALVFSPDGMHLAVTSDGVYDIASGQKRFPISGSASSVFNPDGSQVVVGRDAVYDLASGQKRFPISGFNSVFSPDGSLLVTPNGVYDLSANGHDPVFEFPYFNSPSLSPYGFNSQGNLILFNYHQVCLLVGLRGTSWPHYTEFIATTAQANIRVSPGLSSFVSDTRGKGELMAVLEVSRDGEWYRVGEGQWISRTVVRILRNSDGSTP